MYYKTVVHVPYRFNYNNDDEIFLKDYIGVNDTVINSDKRKPLMYTYLKKIYEGCPKKDTER